MSRDRSSGEAVDESFPFINRELSWLSFNERVLEEALDERHPLLERVKFLAIFFNNLDEFFMIRVSALQLQRKAGVVEVGPDGMTSTEVLDKVAACTEALVVAALRCWRLLQETLKARRIEVCGYESLTTAENERLERYFDDEVFPILTPLAVEREHQFPHISILTL